MIEQGLGFYLILAIILMALLSFSGVIPIWGFIQKRLKGLLIGCLLQLVFCVLVSLLALFGVYYFQKYELGRLRKAAMVSLKKTDADGNTHIWHLKPDEECFYELREKDLKMDFLFYDNIRLYDVVPIDSSAVCVDDVIEVRFDIDKQQVTATKHGEPIDVATIDWEKVKNYLQKQL